MTKSCEDCATSSENLEIAKLSIFELKIIECHSCHKNYHFLVQENSSEYNPNTYQTFFSLECDCGHWVEVKTFAHIKVKAEL